MKQIALLTVVLALGACDRAPRNQVATSDAPSAASADAAAPDAGSLSIDVPGFKAKVDIPNLSVAGGGGDAIDGVPLYPGTHISGASVFAADRGDNGEATLRYSAPATPAAVLAYYRDHATRSGYRIAGQSADRLSASKPDGSGFTIVAHGGRDGETEGTLTASGK